MKINKGNTLIICWLSMYVYQCNNWHLGNLGPRKLLIRSQNLVPFVMGNRSLVSVKSRICKQGYRRPVKSQALPCIIYYRSFGHFLFFSFRFFIFNQIVKMTITHATFGRLKENVLFMKSG